MGTHARAKDTRLVRGAIGFPRCARDDSSSLRSEFKLIFNLKTTADPSRAGRARDDKEKSQSPHSSQKRA